MMLFLVFNQTSLSQYYDLFVFAQASLSHDLLVFAQIILSQYYGLFSVCSDFSVSIL